MCVHTPPSPPSTLGRTEREENYKLPTPLPLLLQCRGGRRLSQVVFTNIFVSNYFFIIICWGGERVSTCERQPVYTPIVDRREICFGVVRADFHQKLKTSKNTTHFPIVLRTCFHFPLDSKRLVSCLFHLRLKSCFMSGLFFFFFDCHECVSRFFWGLWGGHIPNGIIIHREILSRSNPFPFRKLQFYFFFSNKYFSILFLFFIFLFRGVFYV